MNLLKKFFCLLFMAVLLSVFSLLTGSSELQRDILSGTNWTYSQVNAHGDDVIQGIYFTEDGFIVTWEFIYSYSIYNYNLWTEYSINYNMLILYNVDLADGIGNIEYTFKIKGNHLILEYEGETIQYTRIDMTPEEYHEKYGVRPGG